MAKKKEIDGELITEVAELIKRHQAGETFQADIKFRLKGKPAVDFMIISKFWKKSESELLKRIVKLGLAECYEEMLCATKIGRIGATYIAMQKLKDIFGE